MHYTVELVELVSVMDDDQEFRIIDEDRPDENVTPFEILTPDMLGGLPPEDSEEILGYEIKRIKVSDDGVLDIYIKG